MTLAGTFEIVLTIALVLIAAYPLGAFMADVFENRRTFLTPLVGPIERLFYRAAGVDTEVEQKWHEFAISMVIFGGGCFFASRMLRAIHWPVSGSRSSSIQGMVVPFGSWICCERT